jgi:hypothetical protein
VKRFQQFFTVPDDLIGNLDVKNVLGMIEGWSTFRHGAPPITG